MIDDLLSNAASYEETFDRGALVRSPRRKLAIVTCMDARIDLGSMLGLREGDAHVIRNAGGLITDDEIRSLAISQRMMGTRSIMLVHHTDCGMLFFSDEEFRRELKPRPASPCPGSRRTSRTSTSMSASRSRASARAPSSLIATTCAGSSTRWSGACCAKCSRTEAHDRAGVPTA